MALTKSVLKMTETEVVVKVAGAAGGVTIDLATDLVDVNQTFIGVTAAQLATVQDNYDGAYAVLEDMFSQRSGQTGYPWGLTVPVGWYTIDEIQRLAPGTIPNAGSLTAAAQTLKNSWLMLNEYKAALLKVTITGVRWSGELGSVLTINRSGTRVLTLPCDTADYIAFDGQEMPPETTGADSDIDVVEVGTGNVEIYLKLRKVSGYAPKVETAQFSVYDNPNVVGS